MVSMVVSHMGRVHHGLDPLKQALESMEELQFKKGNDTKDPASLVFNVGLLQGLFFSAVKTTF
jgi:chromosome condensin MukBEF ATPase and DNA-binding subunit MukB